MSDTLRLAVSLADEDTEGLTTDELACTTAEAIGAGLGLPRDRWVHMQSMAHDALATLITRHVAEAAPRNVVELAAQSIRGLSWEGLLAAAKLAGIEAPR
jgi:GDP-D-mannose dehydratase